MKETDFNKAILKLDLSDQGVTLARAILCDGLPVSVVADTHGLTRQGANKIKNKVLTAAGINMSSVVVRIVAGREDELTTAVNKINRRGKKKEAL